MATFKEIISSYTPVLVDFHADWCGPCKVQAPILQEVKAEWGNKLRVVKIDVDKNQAVASKYKVQGVPTLILFKEGKPVWRQSGVVQANQLNGIVQSFA